MISWLLNRRNSLSCILGLPGKGRAIKWLVVCWVFLELISYIERLVLHSITSGFFFRKVLLLYPIMSSGNKVCKAIQVIKEDYDVPEVGYLILYSSQGERGQWTVNYIGTQKCITMLKYLLA